MATAIIGASRPDQVDENVEAAGVRIPAEALSRIDAALGDIVERDPVKTLESSPKTREAWAQVGISVTLMDLVPSATSLRPS